MKKPLIILAVTASFLVGAYLLYDRLRSPCGEIFEQTVLNVRTRAEVIKTKGELFVGREKIQELTSTSQKVGQHLKTCCIVLESGRLNSDQFQRCIETAQSYEAKLTKVVALLDEAQTAKQRGNPDLVKEKVQQISSSLDAAESSSEQLAKQISELPHNQQISSSPDAAESSSEQLAKQIREISKEEKWEIIANPKLKGALGRLVISLPEDAKFRVDVYEPGGKSRLAGDYEGRVFELLPDKYDVSFYGARVASVPIQRGADTRMRAGVLNVMMNSRWDLYDDTKTSHVTGAYDSLRVGLPVGKYYMKVANVFGEVIIKDGQIINF